MPLLGFVADVAIVDGNEGIGNDGREDLLTGLNEHTAVTRPSALNSSYVTRVVRLQHDRRTLLYRVVLDSCRNGRLHDFRAWRTFEVRKAEHEFSSGFVKLLAGGAACRAIMSVGTPKKATAGTGRCIREGQGSSLEDASAGRETQAEAS